MATSDADIDGILSSLKPPPRDIDSLKSVIERVQFCDSILTSPNTLATLETYPSHSQLAIKTAPNIKLELILIRLASAIRNKKGWQKKVKDPLIRTKWRDEALGSSAAQYGVETVSELFSQFYFEGYEEGSVKAAEDAVDLVIGEAWEDAEKCPLRYGIRGVYVVDETVGSAKLAHGEVGVGEKLKRALVEAVEVLEDVPDDKKDWHPGSNNQVLDLVHPSLYCFVQDLTKIYTTEESNSHRRWNQLLGLGDLSGSIASSAKFQWLPSQFHIRPDGTVSIQSYINNLHPLKHPKLYRVIEQVFAKLLPLFENCLADLAVEWMEKCLEMGQQRYFGEIPENVKKAFPVLGKYISEGERIEMKDLPMFANKLPTVPRTRFFERLDPSWYVFDEGQVHDFYRWKKQVDRIKGLADGDDMDVDSDDSEAEADYDDWEEKERKKGKGKGKAKQVDTRKVCMYGQKCYRKNPVHFAEYAHPWLNKDNEGSESDSEDTDADEDNDNDRFNPDDHDTREKCSLKHKCKHTDAKHYAEFAHPWIKLLEGQDGEEPEQKDGEDDAVFEERFATWEEEMESQTANNPFAPIPFPSLTPSAPPPPLSLRNRTVQVIVKIATIELTPDNPTYAGGSWHLEGMANEHIIASGIYYFATENITESKLDFRQAINYPDYQQNDERGVAHFYGIDGPLNEQLGYVTALEGRAVVFPNKYQHHVSPFKLEDPTKPGFRKILCFFLIHPHREVLDTSCVPPQQRAWVKDDVERILTKASKAVGEGLPPELVGMIWERAVEGFGMSEEEAKEFRVELMEERKPGGTSIGRGYRPEHVFEEEFSLCEH
ncbi:hypothetical protein HK097_006555 [Rhizophlyctis rosea]|uniref:Aprataxin and PNK-like factor PBZ domain-containing protein n=1 Tax=Rhizophlyctis rosea TaxID=64517 RepID=A0AAD5SFT1_9FUNG|nr:hypothetical protein HK097_006555 [Rhizophlyctis rosea]